MRLMAVMGRAEHPLVSFPHRCDRHGPKRDETVEGGCVGCWCMYCYGVGGFGGGKRWRRWGPLYTVVGCSFLEGEGRGGRVKIAVAFPPPPNVSTLPAWGRTLLPSLALVPVPDRALLRSGGIGFGVVGLHACRQADSFLSGVFTRKKKETEPLSPHLAEFENTLAGCFVCLFVC